MIVGARVAAGRAMRPDLTTRPLMNSPTPAPGTAGSVARSALRPRAGDAVESGAAAGQPDGEIGPAVKPNEARPGLAGGAGP